MSRSPSTRLHGAHEAQRQVTGHGSGDMRDMLRNYGSLRIFTPAPGTMRGWAEPEWLGGNGLDRAAAQKAACLLAELRGAGVTV